MTDKAPYRVVSEEEEIGDIGYEEAIDTINALHGTIAQLERDKATLREALGVTTLLLGEAVTDGTHPHKEWLQDGGRMFCCRCHEATHSARQALKETDGTVCAECGSAGHDALCSQYEAR